MSEYLWSGRTATWTNDSRTWLNSLFTGTAVMGMSTDMPHRHLSTWTTYSGTWDSLASQTEEWGYVPSIAVPRTATFAATLDTPNPVVGFALVAEAVFALSAGQTSSATSIYPSSITLAVTQDQSSAGNLVYVESITFANTLNIPLPGTTTWNLETSTWASTTGSWGYAPPVTLAVSANITQVMLSGLNAEDVEKIASALMPTDLGVSATVTLVMPFSGTLANEQDMKFNINFEETATLGATSGITSINNFLWNDEAEDTGTTWTKVSDPDE